MSLTHILAYATDGDTPGASKNSQVASGDGASYYYNANDRSIQEQRQGSVIFLNWSKQVREGCFPWLFGTSHERVYRLLQPSVEGAYEYIPE